MNDSASHEDQTMETTAQNDFDRAMDVISQSTPFHLRQLIFKSYVEADYYYRHEPVRLLQSAMEKAIAYGDEDLEVDCANALYDLLSSRMSSKRAAILEECLIPLSDVIHTSSAKGKLSYFIGKAMIPLRDPRYEKYIRTAIDFGNDAVMQDEEVIDRKPDFILIWLEKYLGNAEKSDLSDWLENRLNKKTEKETSRPKYCYRLATMHKKKRTGKEDRYFRECIRLGIPEVVTSKDFLKPEYEDEYIKWYESVFANDPIQAKDKCLSKLWETDSPQRFEKSRKMCCESLLGKRGLFDEAYSEYVLCAEDGFTWADDFLIKCINNKYDAKKVLEPITDALITRWSHFPVDNDAVYLALGRLLAIGKGTQCVSKAKQFYCRCLLKLEEGITKGDLQAFWAPFRDFLQLPEREGRFTRRLHEKFEREIKENYRELLIREFSRRRPVLSIRNNMAELLGIASSGQDYNSFALNPAVKRLLASEIKTEDIRFLRSYLNNGSFPAELSMFRKEGTPLVSRYLLLRTMSKVVSNACYNASERERDTMYNQRGNFENAAQEELDLSLAESDYFALMIWMAENLYKTRQTAEAESCLFLLATVVPPEQSMLPFFFLVNLFAKDPQNECLLLLRLIIKNDTAFENWKNFGNPEELMTETCRFFVETAK